VSSGAPFRHFEDKTALMGAVAEEGASKLEAEVERVMAEAPEEPAEQFRAMGVAYVLFAVRHPGHFRVMHRPEYATDAVRASWERGRDRMRRFIAEGQAAGTLATGDPEMVILTAQALVYGVARMFVDGLMEAEGIGRERVAEIAEAVTAQLGLGLGGGPSG
jgi:AcrR family transcriptional regulator